MLKGGGVILSGTYSGNKGKSFERWVAKFLGLNRNPLSGANNVNDDGTSRSGDIIHPTIEIECKWYAKVGIFKWWEKLTADRDKSGKPYQVLIVRQDGAKGRPVEALAVVSLLEWMRLKRKAGEL